MDRRRRRTAPHRGFTLLELAVALGILGVTLSLALPLGRRTLDRWTAQGVRDHALAALHRTRMEARILGGASLEVDGEAGRLVARAADSVLWVRYDPMDAGVTVALSNGAPRTTVTFDALGLGVVASRTLVFRRGDAEARLVISSRGRGSRR